jgi:hypothetical protein
LTHTETESGIEFAKLRQPKLGNIASSPTDSRRSSDSIYVPGQQQFAGLGVAQENTQTFIVLAQREMEERRSPLV